MATGLIVIQCALFALMTYLVWQAVGCHVCALPWYPRYELLRNRVEAMTEIVHLVRAGAFSQKEGYEQYRLTVGIAHLRRHPDYLFAIYDAAIRHDWQRTLGEIREDAQ